MVTGVWVVIGEVGDVSLMDTIGSFISGVDSTG